MTEAAEILKELSSLKAQGAVGEQKLVEIGRDIGAIKAHLSVLNGKVNEHALKLAAREAAEGVLQTARDRADELRDRTDEAKDRALETLTQDAQQRRGAKQQTIAIIALVGLVSPIVMALVIFFLSRQFPLR